MAVRMAASSASARWWIGVSASHTLSMRPSKASYPSTPRASAASSTEEKTWAIAVSAQTHRAFAQDLGEVIH